MDENEFVETVKSHVKIADEALLRKAYNFAKNAHRDQKRTVESHILYTH